jgi:hypothetical protein
MVGWTLLLLLFLSLVFTIGAAANRLPLWPAVLMLIVLLLLLVVNRPDLGL